MCLPFLLTTTLFCITLLVLEINTRGGAGKGKKMFLSEFLEGDFGKNFLKNAVNEKGSNKPIQLVQNSHPPKKMLLTAKDIVDGKK